jgi:hypothetical protein
MEGCLTDSTKWVACLTRPHVPPVGQPDVLKRMRGFKPLIPKHETSVIGRYLLRNMIILTLFFGAVYGLRIRSIQESCL